MRETGVSAVGVTVLAVLAADLVAVSLATGVVGCIVLVVLAVLDGAGSGSGAAVVMPIAVRGITVLLGVVVSGAGAVVTGLRGARGLYSPFIIC